MNLKDTILQEENMSQKQQLAKQDGNDFILSSPLNSQSNERENTESSEIQYYSNQNRGTNLVDVNHYQEKSNLVDNDYQGNADTTVNANPVLSTAVDNNNHYSNILDLNHYQGNADAAAHTIPVLSSAVGNNNQ